MKIPNTLMIGGHLFRVEVGKMTDDDAGELLREVKVIRINEKLSEDERWSSLFHEALHGAFFISGHEYILTDDKDEAIIRCIEHMIFPLVEFKRAK